MRNSQKKQRSATMGWSGVATVGTLMVATLPMVPAIGVNLDQAAGQGMSWTVAAVGSVVCAALFAETAKRAAEDRRWFLSTLWGCVALFLVYINVTVALSNASHISDHRSDSRRSEITTASERRSQVVRLSHRRTEQVRVAGETAPATVAGEISRLMAEHSSRWRSTHECNPTKTTAKASKTFCADLADLKAKHAAALERDKLDKAIDTINAKVEASGETPTSAEPYVDRMAEILALIGLKITNEVRQLIKASRDWVRAIGLELMAALGPKH